MSPEPATCMGCGERFPTDAPPLAAAHADCDRPRAGIVTITGAFAPLDPIDEHEAMHRRGELVATLGDILDTTPLDELAFALRVAAEDRDELEELRALLCAP